MKSRPQEIRMTAVELLQLATQLYATDAIVLTNLTIERDGRIGHVDVENKSITWAGDDETTAARYQTIARFIKARRRTIPDLH